MTEPTNMTPDDRWLARVTEFTNEEWGQQGFRFPLLDQAGEIKQGIEEVRACGIKRLIERRYPDFGDRVRNVASLIVAVVPLLAANGQLTDAEYEKLLHADLRRQLPFLDGSVRQNLACRLIAESARR